MTKDCVLQTQRLFLVELKTRDIDFIAELLGDPIVMQFWPRPFTYDESERWIEKQQARYARDGCGYWLAVEKSTGEPVGQVGLMMIDIDGVSEPGLGYIIHRPFQRQGLAYEAAKATIDWAFNTCNLSRVVAPIRPENGPSMAVAKKLGMTLEKRTMFAGFEHDIYVARQ